MQDAPTRYGHNGEAPANCEDTSHQGAKIENWDERNKKRFLIEELDRSVDTAIYQIQREHPIRVYRTVYRAYGHDE